jgi:uncharacterized protein with HEPN domain
MRRDDQVYVRHMLDTCELAIAKLSGKSRREYDGDDTLRLALAHLVQTVGEAAARLSPAFKERHTDVPWAKVIGMRHHIVHDYLDVDYDIVWDVVLIHLPPLADQLRQLTGRPG